MDVKKVLVGTFFGPTKGGVYSPSVQSTLYDMAKAVLARLPIILAIVIAACHYHQLIILTSNFFFNI